ncbi:MAG: amidohydrolase family protein [Blautia sp.]|nr:amidohydrolase family protein [Blautia sp.]MDY5663972.1 amidohydrolase family protein [Blautia sp.]
MFDYLIKNGLIVNGKKEKAFPGAVGVKDGKIAEVFHSAEGLPQLPGNRILDAKGGYVTPGFIDIHRHGDWEALRNGDDELLNRQGLTTVVNGNCGLSVAPAGERYAREIMDFLGSVTGDPSCGYGGRNGNQNAEGDSRSKRCDKVPPAATMAEYMTALGHTKRSVNTGMLAGNGTIRASVKGYASGKLSREEQKAVWKALEESMEAGALGVSLGIAYAPEFEYDREGLVEALQPLKNSDIPITVHVRNEGDGELMAMREIIAVAKALHIPLHVSHLKCIGKKNWGKRPREILKLFDEAVADGVQVDFDLYPYLTGSTQLVHVLPPECQQGGTEAILARLSDPVCRKKLTEILQKPSDEFENIVELAGLDKIYASTLHTAEYAPYAGQSIAEIAGQLGRDPYDTLYDILLAEKCRVTMLDTIASEEDMLYFLADERANLISDAIYPAGGKYHPRVCGAFPKLLVDYVRDKKVFSIEDAIYKMTAKPAGVLHMERGILDVGMPADINVFHLENLAVPADFDHPDRFCTGFDYVMVNGQIVVEKDIWRNSGCGQVIPGWKGV